MPLANDVNVLFYGQWYDRFYIGSNGYITFGSGDAEYEATLENHFNIPRISPAFADLTPTDIQSISYKQLDDRIAVTFRDVPIFGDKNAKNSFQVEIFFVDGTICISWLDLNTTSSIMGISEGVGIPPVLFTASDLSTYPPCWPLCDFDRNYFINFTDYSILAKYWMNTNCGIPYWCEKSDVDFSGTIDSNDLGILAGDWLLEADYWWLQPISHWKFDEGDGNTAYDSVGNNDGTLVGDPNWVPGKVGDYALDFDGDDDYADCGNDESLNFGTGDFTIAGWFKTSYTGSQWLIEKVNESAPWIGCRIIQYNNNIEFETMGASAKTETSFAASLITDGNWHHIAAVRENTGVSLWLDGVLTASDTGTIRDVDTTNDLVIGITDLDKVSNPFNGTIDDVRVYNRALSAEEILQLYQESL